MTSDLQTTIEAAWDDRDTLGLTTQGAVRDAVETALAGLDDGSFRVAERQSDGMWQVNQWLKKAVLLSFRLNDMELIEGGPGGARWWDKVPSKFAGWGENRFRDAGFRAVPGSIVRRGAFISKGAVLMPSFVNIGAYVGEGSMVDAWATVGSCAQIGANVHLSGGAGIGGVLEPLQAGPTIIEDNCFIGARAEVADDVIVARRGAVDGRLSRRLDQDRRPRDGRSLYRRSAALCRRRARRAAGQAAARRVARPVALLRGDREARRCQDARQNRDQRVAARLRISSRSRSEWWRGRDASAKASPSALRAATSPSLRDREDRLRALIELCRALVDII